MTVEQILSRFPQKSALVVGDICLDRWCTYDPSESEPSRETGLPRVAVVSTETTPGAGGTVANNLAALGLGRVAVLGAVGDDGNAYELTQALQSRGIESPLVRSKLIATFTYTKLLNASTGEEDRPRIDFINKHALPQSLEDELLLALTELAPQFDIIFVSDQAETPQGGVVTKRVREALSKIEGKIIWADSRLRPELFRNVIVKVNESEAKDACHRLFGRPDYALWRSTANAPLLIVTHGPRGALIIENEETFVPTNPIPNPIDICGAGDSFSAGAASALSVGATPTEAAAFGNLVASITVMKRGTGTATPAELLNSH
jgi:rfaE bifunctional protein kinase chain/domain